MGRGQLPAFFKRKKRKKSVATAAGVAGAVTIGAVASGSVVADVETQESTSSEGSPEISLFQDTVFLEKGDISTSLFGVGVGATSGGIIFALSSGVVQAYSNYQFFQRLPTEISQTLNTLSPSDFDIPPSEISQGEIKNKVKKLLKNYITRKTIQPGLLSTLSISGGIFSLGLLFPPLFPITSMVSLGVLGVGGIATAIATLYHRKKVDKLTEEFFKNNSELLDKKLERLKHTQDPNSIQQPKKSTKLSDLLLGTSLLTGISVKAKYAAPLIGAVAGGVQSGIGFLKATYNAFTNYRDRQLRLKNLSGTLQSACDPNIFQKKYLFFGKSKFENYILEHKSEIIDALNIKGSEQWKGNTVAPIIKHLQTPGNEAYCKKLVINCRKQETVKNIKKYFEREKIELSSALNPEDKFKHGLKKYINDAVKKSVKQDVRNAGRINTLLVAGSIASMSIIMPPLAGIFLVSALGAAIIGLGVTELVAYYEQRKFQKKMNQVLGSSDHDTNKVNGNSIQTITCRKYYEEMAKLDSEFLPKPTQQEKNQSEFQEDSQILDVSLENASHPLLFSKNQEAHPSEPQLPNSESHRHSPKR